jgi:hypothetical protein
MKNLLYISYGVGLHQQEAIFSLLSALHWNRQKPDDLRFLIFTDRPAGFSNLPATVEFIEPEQWRTWSGPTLFNHRCKILALQHALRKYRAPTALLDADTWFRKSPHELFERITPGKSLLHIREARICDIATREGRKVADFVGHNRFASFAGDDIAIPVQTDLWNAGVVGLDPANVSVLDEVLNLTDQFCARSNLHILEQLAFSFILPQRTQLQESYDIVFHYWPPYLHEPFRKKIPDLMERHTNLPLKARAARYYAERPRPTLPRRVKVILKRCLQGLGLLRGRSKSNEW